MLVQTARNDLKQHHCTLNGPGVEIQHEVVVVVELLVDSCRLSNFACHSLRSSGIYARAIEEHYSALAPPSKRSGRISQLDHLVRYVLLRTLNLSDTIRRILTYPELSVLSVWGKFPDDDGVVVNGAQLSSERRARDHVRGDGDSGRRGRPSPRANRDAFSEAGRWAGQRIPAQLRAAGPQPRARWRRQRSARAAQPRTRGLGQASASSAVERRRVSQRSPAQLGAAGPHPPERRRRQRSTRAAQPEGQLLQCGVTTAGVVSGARLSSERRARNHVRGDGDSGRRERPSPRVNPNFSHNPRSAEARYH